MIGTEAPVQRKVVELLAGAGWLPVERKDMVDLRAGRMGEALVEPLVVDGLRAVNEGMSELEGLQIVEQLRRIPDTETFLEAVRSGVIVKLGAEDTGRRVLLVDWSQPERNRYVVTTEFELKTGALREPRLDVVCLVNGIPLGVVETKAPTHDWKEAARDLRNYWKDAPELERYSAVCVATNGFRFRCAPSGADKATRYSEWKDPWPHQRVDDMDEMQIGVLGLLDPHNLADIAANFIVFETRGGKTSKKLARYQQFRGANKLVERVRSGELDRGIIWHTQGSGKSLTMIFAARKLMNIGLGNPTVIIVVDRVDLDDQINETFTACSFRGIERATNRGRLRDLLGSDARGVIITTVQKFDESMSVLSERDNVIVMVDEAHRTQEGTFGTHMRAALPKGHLFAFTGTPIETSDRSTRRSFSPEIDGKYENYLDVYTPKEAVDDGATVEVRYEPRLVELAHFDPDEIDKAFEALADEDELSEEDRERVKGDAARLSVIAKGDERIGVISEDVVSYLRERTIPQGFKAQLVAVDRDACVAYAEEMLRQGLASEELAVIYTINTKKDDDAHRRWYATEQLARRGVAADTEEVVEQEDAGELDVSEAKARKRLIADFKDPASPVKLLIVCDMLLTGFDAPVEQVMFLDKPLRGAKLLQAIMRTNRPYAGAGTSKDRGIIVDYWGVFERLQLAFAEFSPDEVELAVRDLSQVRDQFPVHLAEALALVGGMPADTDDHAKMMWLLKRFTADEAAAKMFEERFQLTQSDYESLSPDAALAPHLGDYKRLVRIRALWRHGARLDGADGNLDLEDYRPHTHALVKDAVVVERLRDDLPIYRIDGEYVKKVEAGGGDPGAMAAEVTQAITYEIRERGDDDPIARSLAERLERIRSRKEAADEEMLQSLFDLASDWSREQEASEALGLSERAKGFLSIAKAQAPEGVGEGRLVALARDLDGIVEKQAAFPDWVEREDVLREIRREVLHQLLSDAELQPLVKGGFVDEALTVAVARHGDE